MAGKTITIYGALIQFDLFGKDEEIEASSKTVLEEVNLVLKTHMRTNIPQIVIKEDAGLKAIVTPIVEEDETIQS